MQTHALVNIAPPRQSGLLRLSSALVVVLAIFLAGCTLDQTEQRVGTGAVGGAAVGAAAGAIFGAMAGVPGTGAAIGAAVGTAVGGTGGYIVDQQKKRQATEAENRRLQEENRQLRQQDDQSY